jgi:hypothetical protein
MVCLKRFILMICGLGLAVGQAFGLGDRQFVGPKPTAGAATLEAGGRVAPIIVDRGDWPGVGLAVGSFAEDLKAVSGIAPKVLHEIPVQSGDRVDLILVGTIGRSALIDRLIEDGRIDVNGIRGQWEASLTQVVERPMPGVRRAIVIAGADKRGTIFGVYGLSEQMGVSPWTWWADVPVRHKDAMYVEAGRFVVASPRVKYRGIFLNDEAPALSGWTEEKFGGFNSRFYVHVFELLLRLRANFLWPAMWGSAFNEDDPLNPALADEYGIVMSTSHHEPMMRAQQEWKRHGKGPWDYTQNAGVLDKFWRDGVRRNKSYENIYTVGMRGDGDMPMSAEANTSLLERIVGDQRKILAEEVSPDLTKVPQVWALYKEVQGYYEKGMPVPDDVTLLWCDDNWGNLRRLPTEQERKRSGGAGIYYHFDYVGEPRDYKWLNTNPIQKVWEQMNLAVEYGADRIWVVNVGDLKPMEFPIEFFLTMAREPELWGKDRLTAYTEAWAAREFGPEHAVEIAQIMNEYTLYNGRRKPELLSSDTYSQVNFDEADRVNAAYQDTVARAEKIGTELPEDARAAFFELVLYPAKASAVVQEMYLEAGRNALLAREGRASANEAAAKVRRLFAEDAQLTREYNGQLSGKWDHMMDQTHLGYFFWQEPPLNAMPKVTEVRLSDEPKMCIAVSGDDRMGLPKMSLRMEQYSRQRQFIDLFSSSLKPFTYRIAVSKPWLTASRTGGAAATDTRVFLNVDWDRVPPSGDSGRVVVSADGGPSYAVEVKAVKRGVIDSGDFVEADGEVTMDANHVSATSAAGGVRWEELPGFGETGSGMESFPVTASSSEDTAKSPCMDYKMELFDVGAMRATLTLAPTLGFVPGRGLRIAVGIDAATTQVVDTLGDQAEGDWSQWVSDGVRRVDVPLSVSAPGEHTLHVCRVDAGVVVERVMVSNGEIPYTYLGPPESFRAYGRGEGGTAMNSSKRLAD